MKHLPKITALILICMCLFGPVLHAKSTTGYYPIRIVNKPASSKNVKHTYITMLAQYWTAQQNYCILQLTYNPKRKAQVASLVPITAKTDSRLYSYAIDSLQGYDAKTQTITILIPHLQSGRTMISLNYPLYMPPVIDSSTQTWSLQAPSISNIGDVNNDIIYDKYEYSFDTTGTEGKFYINPTAVDFFSIPISLRCGKQSSGPDMTKTRDQLMNTMTATLAKYDKSSNKTWQTLVSYDASKKTLMRLVAPNLSPYFNPNYLTIDSTTKFSYINTLISYYQTNTLQVNCNELNTSAGEVYQKYKQSPAQNPGAYSFTGKMNSANYWVFQNNPAGGLPKIVVNINMDSVTTENFIGPGTGPFATPNQTVLSIIVKNITAAFTASLLPAPNGMLIDSTYLINPKYPHYQTNTYLKAPANSGPWYNLYAQSVHSAIPIIYAFAYDDVLGEDGTLVSGDTTVPVVITLGNMGDIIVPKHTNDLPVYPVVGKYNSGFSLLVTGQDSFYVDTVRWSVPLNQPKNAKYYLLPNGKGAGFTANTDSLIALQAKKFYSWNDSVGVLKVPVRFFSSSAPGQVYMQVFTCGSPGCSCSYQSVSKTPYCAVGSAPIAPSGAVTPSVFAATITSYSGLVLTGTNYVATMSWTYPPNQPSNANYYFLLVANGSSTFTISTAQLIALQQGNTYAYNKTSGTLTIPQSELGAKNPSGIQIQILTCGGPGCPCLSTASLNCSPASPPVAPTSTTAKPPKNKAKK